VDPAVTTSIFISYAHKDGTDLARTLHDDLKASGYEVWLDRSRLTGGASWSADIEEALDRSDVVLALLSHGSFQSDICRGEQLRALRMGKRVIPLMLADEADRPLFLETRQYSSSTPLRPYPDLRRELIAAILGSETATLATSYRQTYVTAPRLPPNVVARPEALTSLRQMVLNEERLNTIAVAAIVGMGGAGKTTLARMLCHDRAVQDAFPDGVIWAGLSHEISDLVPKMREVGRALGDESKHYDTAEGASNRLRTILRNKAALIVLDDVWDLKQIEPFLADAPASSLLITTRKQDIPVSLGAKRAEVGILSEAQSLEVLERWTGVPRHELPSEAAAIVRECGRLPLALAMIGGLVRGALLKGRTDAWPAALYRLKQAQLDQIRFPLEHYPYPALLKAIQVSVDALESGSGDRYEKLCVFPEDVAVPERVFETFWKADQYDVQATVDRWLDASLALRDDAGRIILHDLQLDYVRRLAGDRILELHQQLVDRYGEVCKREWSRGPNDGYFFQRLVWHMAGARNWRSLSAVLLDPAFIRAKLDTLSYADLQRDFDWMEECLAAIPDPVEQQLFRELEGFVKQLSWFTGREAETAIIERWLAQDDSQHLIITGTGGMGKTSLLRHTWVRHFRSAVFIESPIPSPESLLAQLVRGMLPLLPPQRRPRLRDEHTREHIVSMARDAAQLSGASVCVLVDGLDEFPGPQHFLLPLLDELSASRLRFILVSRYPPKRLIGGRPGFLLSLDALDKEETRRMLEKLMRDRYKDLAPFIIEKLIERSKGTPFIIGLMADALEQGESIEDLLNYTHPQSGLKTLMERMHLRLVRAGVPEVLLRAITTRLVNGQDAVWDELRQMSNVPESMIATFEQSGIFVLERDGDRHLIRMHPEVLDFLRTRYSL
jgi:hypothetical protein